MSLEEASRLKKKRRLLEVLLDDDSEDEGCEDLFREEPLYRKRWDSEYLLELALNESSFVAEYRMTPAAFACLTDMLTPALSKQEGRQLAVLSNSGSLPVSPMSRVGCALIILAGGRYIEAMRTHEERGLQNTI